MTRSQVWKVGGALLGLAPVVLGLCLYGQQADSGVAAPAKLASIISFNEPGAETQASLSANYGKLPLSFETNQGQTDAQVKFLSRGTGYTLFLTGDAAVLTLRSPSRTSIDKYPRPSSLVTSPLQKTPGQRVTRDPGQRTKDSVLTMALVGANPQPTVAGSEKLSGKANYFIGNDPKRWRTSVPTYAKVRYEGIYPGVDLVYYGNQGELEYDFVVAPGTDPSDITFEVGGHGVRRGVGERRSPLRIAADGDLLIKTDAGVVRLHKPVVYQPAISHGQPTTDLGQRRRVEGRYVLQAGDRVGFKIASYDHTKPLVIDPMLTYSTYLGGSGSDYGVGIAVDGAGNAYVTGQTNSTDFPTASPLQAANGGDGDAFVAKLNAAGSALVYSTYFGGSGSDSGSGIAVDSAGSAYVTGFTASTDFPTTNPLQPTNAGGYDAFVAKLNPTGSALAYSTYLGGASNDYGLGLAVDTVGNAYVTGLTSSANFPTVNPINTASGYRDVFVAKLNVAGSALTYSTYLGNSDVEGYPIFGGGVAVDTAGNAYVTGYTSAADFPTANALQATKAGSTNAFVAKLNATGSALVYSTFLGGSYLDYGTAIAADSAGNAYVTGFTYSTDFPTASPFQAGNAGGVDAFVAKLSATGSALLYSTYLGGGSNERGQGIAVDNAGNAYVTGYTPSRNFPTANAFQGGNAGPSVNTYVAEFSPTGSLVYSSYLGGSGPDFGLGIAVDTAGSAYVTGQTYSTNFPTVNPLQAANAAGGGTAFVAKIAPTVLTTTTTITSSANPSVFGQSLTLTATVNPSSGTPTGTVTFSDGSTTLATVTLTSGQATFTTSSFSVGSHSLTATYSGDPHFSGSASSALTQTVNQAATSIAISTSTSPSTVNQSVTFTATVKVQAPGAGAPTGTVTFKDGSTTLGSATLGSGTAAFTNSSLTAGTHSVTAVYGGDSNFLGSTSAALTQTVAYGVCVLYDQTKSVKGGAVIPIKLYLCDVNGNDVSASTIVVHATQITSVSGFSGPPEAPGNANPDSDFRYDITQGPSGGYIYNLSTNGLASGTYSMNFTAGSDPTIHVVTFGVK